MSTNNTPPAPTAAPDDAANFRRYGSGGLGVDNQVNMIGGTYLQSTKIDPAMALTGGYQPLNNDSMPAGAPVDGNPPYTGPYLPNN
jgi:hypothetical protein